VPNFQPAIMANPAHQQNNGNQGGGFNNNNRPRQRPQQQVNFATNQTAITQDRFEKIQKELEEKNQQLEAFRQAAEADSNSKN
jgi:hypothetical protein